MEIEDKTGKQETLEYDSLILATGSKTFVPPVKGIDKEGVYALYTIEEGKMIEQAIKKAKSAVVIGSGFLGLEAAVALTEQGVKTTVVEMLSYILPRMLDQDMTQEVQGRLEEKGLRIIVGHAAEEVLGNGRVRGVSVAGEEIPADLVINAAGVRPTTELAQQAGIVIGETRGIKTNIRMQTSVKDVYAAGDCAETIHMVTQGPALPALGTTAVRQGRVAGTNAAGGYALYPGCLMSAVSQMFDFEVGATGLTEFWAARYGIDLLVGRITGHTRATYYPGALPIRVKLLVEKETKRVVGGQIVGGEDVTQRINALSLAIQKQMTIYELVRADTCYAPSVCETWEPIVLAAENVLMRLR